MATVNDVASQLITAVDAIAGSHMTSDYRTDVALPSGTQDFQVRVDDMRVDPDSNLGYRQVEIEIAVFRDVGATESSTELDAMRSLQTSLTTRAFFDDLAAIRECVEVPEVVERIERVGNVLSFTVRAIATVQP